MDIRKWIVSLVVSPAFSVMLLSLPLSTPETAVQAASSPEVTISIDVPAEAPVGSIFAATLRVSRVENFDAGNYDVSFDPAVLTFQNATAGQIGSTQIPIDIWNRVSSGTVRIVQNVPGIAGVSGTGSLAVLGFRVIGSAGQTSTITLSNGMLSSNLAEAIAAAWGAGSVRVTSGQALGPVTQPTPPPFPAPTTFEAPRATPDLTPAPDPSPSAPVEMEPGLIPGTAPGPQPPAVVVAPVSTTPGEAPALPTSSEPKIANSARRESGEVPSEQSPAVRSNPGNLLLIWAAAGGMAIFAVGLIIAVFTAKRRPR